MQFVQVSQDGQNSYSLDNAIFDVSSGASMDLSGSSNVVVLENGAGHISITGNGDTVVGSGITGVSLNLLGTGNTATLGDHAFVWDGQDDYHLASADVITVGANSACYLAYSSGATVNATEGGCFIEVAGPGGYVGMGAVINANNDSIVMGGSYLPVSAQVNGNGNDISMGMWTGGDTTLNLNGSNNTISFDATFGTEMIQTTAGYFVKEKADGSISLSASSISVSNGVATVGLGNGNVVTITNVSFGSNGGGWQWTIR
jgi:hypothetical protein